MAATVASTSVTDLAARRQGGGAEAGDGGLGHQGPRAARDRGRAGGADARDPRGERAAISRPGASPGSRPALMDRLALDEERVRGIADGARAIAALPDPVGEVVGGGRLANGLEVRKVRVPLGVIAVVYEARPNVTIDAAALCLKSGNAVLLRGSSSRGALERRAGADRARGGGSRASRTAALGAGRRRRPRGAGRAGHAGGRRRPDHPARRRGPEEGDLGGRDGAGDLRRGGQLPRVRGRHRRSRGCRADHRQRQGPAAGHVQLGRDAAGALVGGGGVPAGRAGGAARARRRAARRRARARDRPVGGARRPSPTGARSSSR